MKPLLIVLTILASVFTQPTFATNRDVTPVVLKSFQTKFASAKEVTWTSSESLFKAHFELNGQAVTAFYSTDGNLLAVSRHITSHQLPLSLQTSLRKGHEGAWISELFELNSEEGITYYATLETADCKVVLKSNGQSWTAYNKNKKD